jgi:hypothetical protein
MGWSDRVVQDAFERDHAGPLIAALPTLLPNLRSFRALMNDQIGDTFLETYLTLL